MIRTQWFDVQKFCCAFSTQKVSTYLVLKKLSQALNAQEILLKSECLKKFPKVLLLKVNIDSKEEYSKLFI